MVIFINNSYLSLSQGVRKNYHLVSPFNKHIVPITKWGFNFIEYLTNLGDS